jgi:hypothetical protein
MQPTRRWVYQSQPQTLLIATWLLYLTAAFTLLFFNDGVVYRAGVCGVRSFGSGGGCTQAVGLLRLVLPAACVAGGYFISNEKKWGYYLAVVAAAVPVAARLVFSIRFQLSPLNYDIIGLAFDVALVALLLHPMSREYQRIWFK